ncbi:hypothetical protein ACFQHN_04230 [Natrialbaceae archaeon GCM10025896]
MSTVWAALGNLVDGHSSGLGRRRRGGSRRRHAVRLGRTRVPERAHA